MPLNADLAAILDRHAAAAANTPTDDFIAALRINHQLQLDIGSPAETLPTVPRIEDRTIGSVPTRIYWPSPTPNLPVVVYLHGGGWITGDLDTSDPFARVLAGALSAVVITVHYRRLPEHPWPAPLEDTQTVIAWVLEHTAELGGDPDRVALIGDSAGTHLAALTSQQFSQLGDRRIALQVLLYPATSMTIDPNRFPSQAEHGHDTLLTIDTLGWLYREIFADEVARRSAVLLGSGVAGHATPTIIATAEIDPLSSEGQQYSDELTTAGTLVERFTGTGLCHGYSDFLSAPSVRSEVDRIIAAMQRTLTTR